MTGKEEMNKENGYIMNRRIPLSMCLVPIGISRPRKNGWVICKIMKKILLNILTIGLVIFLLSPNVRAELFIGCKEKYLTVQVPDTETSVPFNARVSASHATEINGINLVDPPTGVSINPLGGSIYVEIGGREKFIPLSLKIGPTVTSGIYTVKVSVIYSDNEGFHEKFFDIELIITDKNPEITATITNPGKTLTIPIPGKDTFTINVASKANQDATIVESALYWVSIKPLGVEPSYDFGKDPIIKKGKNKDYSMTFTVGTKAIPNKYEFDLILTYTIGGKIGFIRVDPFIELYKPKPTIPPGHSPVPSDIPEDRCDTESCHSTMRGSSYDSYGFIILVISLLSISIIFLIRREKKRM